MIFYKFFCGFVFLKLIHLSAKSHVLLVCSVKDTYTNLSQVMAQVAEQELQQLPEFIESCSMVYIPEVGYLLGLPHWDVNLSDEQLKSLPNLQFMVVCSTCTPSLEPPQSFLRYSWALLGYILVSCLFSCRLYNGYISQSFNFSQCLTDYSIDLKTIENKIISSPHRSTTYEDRQNKKKGQPA